MNRTPGHGARLRLVVTIAVIVGLGLFTKHYQGPLGPWVRGSAGGVFYVVFWTLTALLIRPSLPVAWTALVATLAACAVEASQLWHPGWLDALRATTAGSLMLGSTFAWSDFPPYVAGGGLGYGLGRGVIGRPRAEAEESTIRARRG